MNRSARRPFHLNLVSARGKVLSRDSTSSDILGVDCQYQERFKAFATRPGNVNTVSTRRPRQTIFPGTVSPGSCRFFMFSSPGRLMNFHCRFGDDHLRAHRALSPPAGSTPRYSVPFSQSIRQCVRLYEIKLECMYLFGCGWRVIS